ncbi:MAG: TlpA disulfide reductase family protein [bacterium]|nr:TlpA disulfide reductase family protein [bacterium]
MLRSYRFVVVAIATNTAGLEVVEPFARKFELTFPILLDSDQTASSLYGVRDLPVSFLLDPQGKVIAAAKGERDWFSEQALSYMQEVLNVAPQTQP